jgi:hypothetical protein
LGSTVFVRIRRKSSPRSWRGRTHSPCCRPAGENRSVTSCRRWQGGFGGKHKLLQGILKDKITELNKKVADGKSSEKDQTLVAALKELKAIYKLFPEEVIHPRNTMAHVEKSWDENGKCILKSRIKKHRPICVDHEWCIKARKDLIKHMDNLFSVEGGNRKLVGRGMTT